MFSMLCFNPPPPQKRSVVGKAYFLSNFFSLRDHALIHKGLFFERPIKLAANVRCILKGWLCQNVSCKRQIVLKLLLQNNTHFLNISS